MNIFILGCNSNSKIWVKSDDDVYSLYMKVNSLDSASLFYVKNRYLIDLLLNAKKNESLGLYASAIVDLLEALRYDSSKVILYSIARNFFYLGKYDLAFDYAFSSFLKDKNFDLNLELLVTILQMKGKYSQARFFSELLLNLEKPNFSVNSAKRHLNILENLDTNLTEALKFCDFFPRNKKYLFILEHKINYYHHLGDSLQELKTYDTLLELNDKYFVDQTLASIRYLKLLLSFGEYLKFLKFWKDFVSIENFTIAKIFLLSYNSLFKEVYKKDPMIIENTLRILESRFTKEKDFSFFILNFYYDIGDTQQAEKLEKAILQENEILLENLIQIANKKFTLGQKRSAIEFLEKFSNKFSNEIDYLLFLSYLYLRLDDFENAEKSLKYALNIDSLNEDIYNYLGWLYQKWGKVSLSNENYEKAIEINPRNDVVLNNYAYTLIERGERLDFARKLIESALELSPNNPSFLDTYGWLFFKLKKYQLALQYVLKAVELGVETYEPFLHLSIIYYELGEYKLSEEYMQKVYEMKPDNEKVLKEMKEIIK
ncbi:MAG: tetratricopeptide repeat protein [Candidatus Kapaibacteriales bacterium]